MQLQLYQFLNISLSEEFWSTTLLALEEIYCYASDRLEFVALWRIIYK